jgi:hypothetical protein
MSPQIAYIKERLSNIFTISEIENSLGLKYISGLILVNLFIFFNTFFILHGKKILETHLFNNSDPILDIVNLYFLNNYIQYRGVLFTVILVLIAYSAYSLFKSKFLEMYLSILAIYVLFYAPFFILLRYNGSYLHFPDFYLFLILFAFLFIRGQRFLYLQLFFVLSYFLSSISKIGSDSWIVGSFDFPLLNNLITPIGTNIVILSQIFLCWYLISNNSLKRKIAFIFFELFHLYTCLEIGYVFFMVTSPFIFILFYENFKEFKVGDLYKSYLGIIFVFFLFLSNLIRLIIPGDDFLTFEGAYLGFNMFHHDFTCNIHFQNKDLKIENRSRDYSDCANGRILENLKKNCIDDQKRSLKIILTNKFESYQTVNQQNYCNLEYNIFSRNEWIKPELQYLNFENPEIGNLQKILISNKEEIKFFYYYCFFTVSLYVTYVVLFKRNDII